MLWFFVCLALLSSAFADTPADCHSDLLIGKWTVKMTTPRFDRYINCSMVSESQMSESADVWFYPPSTVHSVELGSGFFTSVYNQGFETRFEKLSFFAFFPWEVQPDGNVTSFCDHTLHGSFHKNDINTDNYGCFIMTHESSTPETEKKVTAIRKTHQNAPAAVPMPNAHVTFRTSVDYLEKLEDASDLFTVKAYDWMQGLKGSAIHALAGGKRRTFTPPKALKSNPKPEGLPTSFDWRDVDGDSYVIPVRNQEHCGSCYTYGSTSALSDRIKYFRKQDTVFATQQIVSCSSLSQGCNGGFPYLVGRYVKDYGLDPETCFPYQAADVPCDYSCDAQKTFVKDYYYIGGYYGGCSAEAMMAEIFQKGPIAISFEVTDNFMHYRGGIYIEQTGVKAPVTFFEETNHIVEIVGWGEENGVPYWSCKNSWGTSWGEGGYFRIRRGTDELAIESMAVGFDLF